jgi:hypothetical protein
MTLLSLAEQQSLVKFWALPATLTLTTSLRLLQAEQAPSHV